MKTKSIQESVLEQIFAFDETCFPSFFHCQPSNLEKTEQQPTNSQLHQLPKYRQPKPLASSMTELEDQILKMRVRAAKMPAKYQDSHGNATISKKQSKNIKTEHFPEETRARANFSTIYTRRSSLDESLYDKAIRQESARKSWVNKKQRELRQEELKQCSYRPSINQTSKQIMSRLDKQEIYEKIKRKKEESIKKIIEDMQARQMKQCSFTPNILQGQKKLTKSIKVQKFTIQDKEQQEQPQQPIRHSISIFDHLYEDSKTRQLKSKRLEETYLQQCSGKPKLDDISRQITKDTNFEERRLMHQKKKLQKAMQKQKENKSLRDSYRPSINFTTYQRSKQIPIGEYLYLQSKRNATPKHESKKPLGEKPIYANKKSTQVYEQRKTLLLDKYETGSISTTNINLELLPREVVKIIYPLIEELEVMQVELQQHEFIHSISNLFKSLTVHEKDILLGFIGGSKESEKEVFKPKLNNRSKMIAACNQRSQMSIYEYCSIKEVEREKQLQWERIEKSKRELQNCTFQPKITSYRR